MHPVTEGGQDPSLEDPGEAHRPCGVEAELKQLDVSDTDIALIDAKAVLFAREKMLKKEIHKKRMHERAQKPLIMRFTKLNGKWVSKVNK